MRKRRRLANKMTIMVCAVLLAVSAFFYAPLEVNASSTVYPKQLTSVLYSNHKYWTGVNWDFPVDVVLTDEFTNNSFWYDPTHSYRFSLYFVGFERYEVTSDVALYSTEFEVKFSVGGIDYAIRYSEGETVHLNVPGDRMSTTYSLKCILHDTYARNSGSVYPIIGFRYDHLRITITDLGPTEDLQGHIENQTDNITSNADKNTDTMVNGFDTSGGDSVNDDLSTGLNEYQSAEDSLFATATTGMKDFTFFDIESVPAMVTGISFITATMTGWFNQAGGASGVGIVLSILFSVMLVAMVLGLYRWYQSRGGKD